MSRIGLYFGENEPVSYIKYQCSNQSSILLDSHVFKDSALQSLCAAAGLSQQRHTAYENGDKGNPMTSSPETSALLPTAGAVTEDGLHPLVTAARLGQARARCEPVEAHSGQINHDLSRKEGSSPC